MSTFDWCAHNKYQDCIRVFEKFIIDPRTNKVVWLGEDVHCVCPKRGCACYLPVKDRPKATKRKRKQ